MPIEFNCDSCSKLLRVPDGSGGKQCLCPSCSKVLDIPVPKASASGPSPANSTSDDTGIALCIPCPRCKHELICDPSLVGTKGQCRSCKHIFVINDLPTSEAASAEQTINWVFSCPKCNQLFEGSEAMEGKRGKCHACGDVFLIELRVADKIRVDSPVDESKAPTNSFDGFDGELTLNAPPNGAHSTSERPSKPNKQTTSSGTVVSRVSPGDLRPIQFNCTSCKGRMEVPGESARQLTHCPHCKRQQTIPSESEPTREAQSASDPWANLSPLGSAPAPMPQASPFGDTMYPPPMPMSSMTSSRGRRRSSVGSQFIACGIFTALFASIAVVIEIIYIVLYTMILVAAPNRDPAASTYFALTLLMWICLLLLSIAQLVGGIALARRSGIQSARTGAIICCLPCFCLFNIPIGIWGCILVFGNDAEREFR